MVFLKKGNFFLKIKKCIKYLYTVKTYKSENYHKSTAHGVEFSAL